MEELIGLLNVSRKANNTFAHNLFDRLNSTSVRVRSPTSEDDNRFQILNLKKCWPLWLCRTASRRGVEKRRHPKAEKREREGRDRSEEREEREEGEEREEREGPHGDEEDTALEALTVRSRREETPTQPHEQEVSGERVDHFGPVPQIRRSLQNLFYILDE